MNLKNSLKRYTRGGVFALKSILWEKPRGLDFSMRQKTVGIKTEGNHGYALTPKKAFDNVVQRLDISASDKFIDIGCGKGGVLYFASKYYPFGRVAGVEIEDSLYEIAVRNFRKPNIPSIEIFHDNAVTFDRYNEFNVFYLFNPFEPNIYREVVDSILSTLNDSRNDSRVYLICYGGTVTKYIKDKRAMELIDSYTDKVRDSEVNIWKWEKKE